MRSNTILVFGISGVGKTTSCLAYIEAHPEYLYFSAGSLLSSALAKDREALRSASTSDILQNQKLLGPALAEARRAEPDRPALVDVHSVIDNDRELIEIPSSVVATLMPTGMILLEASPHVIQLRRQRAVPPRPQRSTDEIANESRVARKVVIQYSKSIGVPLVTGTVGPDFRLDSLVRDLANHGA